MFISSHTVLCGYTGLNPVTASNKGRRIPKQHAKEDVTDAPRDLRNDLNVAFVVSEIK